MASTSPDGDAAAAPLAGTVQVAAGLHARRTPLLATPRVRVLAGIGDVGRAARRFSALTGLSLSARRAMQAQRSDVGHQPVRPPDYWSGYREEELEGASRPSTGDAALDRLVARRAMQKREAAGRPQVRRGLPSTVHRRSRSLAGPMTAPGGMARRLQPATIVPTPNPANSPQTAAARTPRAPRPARPGGRDADRPRPAAPPSTVAARPATRDVPAGRTAPADEPVARRTEDGPSTVGRAAAAVQGAASVAATASGRGLDATPAPAVSPAAGDPSVGRVPSGVAAVRGPVGDGEVAPPPWPGDVDVESAPVPFAPASVGRRVAVRPLLAGWRAPTAWRSIAAAPGVRLLPVGPSALPTSWSPGAAPAGEPAASWAETVRRAAASSSTSPASVRQLPVGGPAVIVREGQAAPGAAGRPTTSWSAPAARTASDPVVLRRRVTAPTGGVEVTSWTLPPGSAPSVPQGPGASLPPSPAGTTTVGSAPGFRPVDHRRPGRWLGRAAVTGGALGWAAARVPMGPLGPVRWTARADEPVVARTTAPGSSWAASVAAASAAMAGTGPLAGSAVRPPVSGGLTLVRGGRADGGDLPVAAVQRAGTHPAATRLRLVPPAPEPASARSTAAPHPAPVGSGGSTTAPDAPAATVRRTATASATPGPTGRSAPATYVGRVSRSASAFVAVPGAVAAHGLPAAAAALVGVTASGAGAGHPATPGALGRLTHGQPIRRRLALDPAPPALVVGGRAPRPGLPSAPAALARRRPVVEAPSGAAAPFGVVPARTAGPDRSTSAPSWAERVAAVGAGASWSSPWATSSPSTPGTVASLRRLPVAPAAFAIAPAAGDETRPSTSGAGAAAQTAAPGRVHRSRTPHGVSATVSRRVRGHRPAPPTVAGRWAATDVPARTLPGRGPAGLRPLVAAAPTVRRAPLRPSAPGAAARFDEVLRTAERPVRPVALPVRFRPLAERIVGRMPVQIATGAPSRAALAAVGARAATTSSVIHLPAPPDGSARSAGVLAHELTHVAAASPVARFHGGRVSAEETAATQVERIVARAARTSGRGRGPSSPGTSGLPVAGFVGVKGSTAGPPVPASVAGAGSPSNLASTISRSPGTTSAADLARRIEGGAAPSSSASRSSGQTVQRAPEESNRAGAAANRTIRRKGAQDLESGLESADDTNVLSEEVLDAIVRALEARLLESIERRGGMWRGGF